MHAQSKPGPVFEQKLCQDILHQNAHGWINIDLGVCGRNLGLRLQPLVCHHSDQTWTLWCRWRCLPLATLFYPWGEEWNACCAWVRATPHASRSQRAAPTWRRSCRKPSIHCYQCASSWKPYPVGPCLNQPLRLPLLCLPPLRLWLLLRWRLLKVNHLYLRTNCTHL